MTFRLINLEQFLSEITSPGRNWKPAQSLLHALRVVKIYRQRSIQRRQLMTLSQAQLSDMGISRCDAIIEAEKPFWKA